MKNCLLIILALLTIAFTSCHKNDSGLSSQLSGTWNVVSDSTYADVGASAGSGNKYIGTATDYFKFTGNSLSIKEGSFRTATATYTVVKDTLKLSYSYLDEGGEIVSGTSTDKYIIESLSSTSLQLREYSLPSPGGVFREYISLSR